MISKIKDLFKPKIRKSKHEDKFDYKGLELDIRTYDIERKRKKKNKCLIEEGGFLLSQEARIIAAGSFFIFEQDKKKCLVIKDVGGQSNDYEKYAIEALKEYSSKKGYKVFR